MRKKIYKVLLVIISIIFVLYVVNDFLHILEISGSYGVSNGLPYCLNCLGLTTSLPIYSEGKLANHLYYGRAMNHRIISIVGNNITFISGKQNYTVSKEAIFGTYIIEWKYKTTNNFKLACEHEYTKLGYLSPESTCENLWNNSYCPNLTKEQYCWVQKAHSGRSLCVEWRNKTVCNTPYGEK